MVTEEYLELIHAEIDGRLPESRRADLSRYLLEHPEARVLRDELRRLSAALAQVEYVAPPSGLRDAVLQAARLPPSGGTGRRWGLPGVLRYAAAFAGGVLVSTIAFHAGKDGGAGIDVSALTGTMASQEAQKQDGASDGMSVSLEQGRGTASLRETPSGLVLEYDLAARDPVRIVTWVAAPGDSGAHDVDFELYAGDSLVQRESLGVPPSAD